MTNDYKEQLLSYLTDNLENTSPTTDEIFKEIVEVNRSNWIGYIPNGWADFHFEGMIQEQNSNNIVLYGGYRTPNSTGINNEVYGIIIIIDNNFNPIKTFYEYDNGTKLRYIQNMKQAEDNSFYMVDDTNFAYEYNSTTPSSTKRLVILNNFATKIDGEYKLILRSSYIFPSGYGGFKCENLTKNPSQAQYILIGKVYDSGAGNYQNVTEISINIPYGSSIEWNKTNIITYVSTIYEDTEGRYLTSFVKYQNDTYQVKVLCGYYHETSSGGQVTSRERYTRVYTKPFNSSTYSYTNILNNPEITGNSDRLENQAIFLNENKVYFVLDNINNTYVTTLDLKIQLWEYDASTSTTTKIYENSYGTGQPAQQEQIYLSVNQGNLYIEDIKKKTSTTADYYVQRYEGTWNPILVNEDKLYVWYQRTFFALSQYNLVQLFIFPANPRGATWYFPVVKEIYNLTQYNGESYVDTNVLSPLYSNLYSNGSLVFSRDLYNISKQNNMTMSSVEIPNNYLNDLTITQNDLISDTNFQMNSDNTQWTKNIYEVVDLNFLNTISIIDSDTNTPYLDGAIKLNNAVTDGTATDYQNTPCNKYRINYTDNTTKINPLYWSSIDNLHKQTMITFYVDKAIDSIDFLSNDETTIYLSLPIEVEIGKYYTINQKLRIGE